MADTPWYQKGPRDNLWPLGDPPPGATPIGPNNARSTHKSTAVYLGDRAMTQIAQALEKQAEVELFGLLLGQPQKNDAGSFLSITDCMIAPSPAPPTDTMLFDESIWSEMRADWERHFSGTIVAGWFHARPGRDRELTSAERIMHERFFPQAWHIALLIESEHQSSTLYQWHDDAFIEAPLVYYWTMENPGTVPPARRNIDDLTQRTVLIETSPTRRFAFPWLWVALLALLYVFAAPTLGGLGWFHRHVADHTEQLTALNRHLAHLEEETNQLQRMAAHVDMTLRAGIAQAQEDPSSLDGVVDGGAPAAAQSASAMPMVGGTDSKFPEQEEPSYVIQPGDTMWRISERLVGDPYAYRLLATNNHISDPDLIFPGQTIYLKETP